MDATIREAACQDLGRTDLVDHGGLLALGEPCVDTIIFCGGLGLLPGNQIDAEHEPCNVVRSGVVVHTDSPGSCLSVMNIAAGPVAPTCRH